MFARVPVCSSNLGFSVKTTNLGFSVGYVFCASYVHPKKMFARVPVCSSNLGFSV